MLSRRAKLRIDKLAVFAKFHEQQFQIWYGPFPTYRWRVVIPDVYLHPRMIYGQSYHFRARILGGHNFKRLASIEKIVYGIIHREGRLYPDRIMEEAKTKSEWRDAPYFRNWNEDQEIISINDPPR